MVNKQKRGKIVIPLWSLETFDIPQAFHRIDFLVMDARHDFCSGETTYIGMSKYFRQLDMGEAMPEYEIVNNHDTGYCVREVTPN